MPIIRLLLASIIMVWPFMNHAYASVPLFDRAKHFIELLKIRHYDDCATFFHYPPSYSPSELVRDKASVKSSFTVLFRKIGNIVSITRVKGPTGPAYTLGFGGGDIPYWSSHPELNQTRVVTYEVKTSNYGQGFFLLRFVRPSTNWELRNFTYEIPAARPHSKERAIELAKKLYETMPKHRGGEK